MWLPDLAEFKKAWLLALIYKARPDPNLDCLWRCRRRRSVVGLTVAEAIVNKFYRVQKNDFP